MFTCLSLTGAVSQSELYRWTSVALLLLFHTDRSVETRISSGVLSQSRVQKSYRPALLWFCWHRPAKRSKGTRSAPCVVPYDSLRTSKTGRAGVHRSKAQLLPRCPQISCFVWLHEGKRIDLKRKKGSTCFCLSLWLSCCTSFCFSAFHCSAEIVKRLKRNAA